MKKYGQLLFQGIFLFATLSIIMGCGKPTDVDKQPTASTVAENPTVQTASKSANVNFNINFSAIQNQFSEPIRNRSTKGAVTLTGTLIAKNQNTNQSETFNWSIAMDDSNWQASSSKTVILSSAPYEFSLLLNRDNQQYAGETIATISDGTNDISMTIRPIIGETIASASLISELTSFKLHYKASELTQYTSPKIGISIDGASEQFYNLNRETGKQAESQFINLTEAQHTIRLNLYDGDLHIGRSKAEHETVTIKQKEPVSIDLVPLYGEATFSLTADDGNAQFDFNISPAIVEEAGGVGNLIVRFSANGPKSLPREITLTVGDISGDGYPLTVTLPNFYSEPITFGLEFLDSSTGYEKLGDCNGEVTLTTEQNTIICQPTLRRRAITGDILLTPTNLNVVDETGDAIAGATLKIGDKVLGLTGTGSSKTIGALRSLLKTGEHRIEAFHGNLYGFINTSLNILEIKNLLITLTSYSSCKDILTRVPGTASGVYQIDPDGTTGANPPFEVYCDMETDSGGWTVIQRRQDGSVDFHRDWSNYKTGFGSADGEHWLGNDNIYRLTNPTAGELRIDMKRINRWTGLKEEKYAQYSTFQIADETNKYQLTISGFSAHVDNPEDAFLHHNGMPFSTKDQDNDNVEYILDEERVKNPTMSCAISFSGAWWYNDCHTTNLNGLYGNKDYGQGLTWVNWTTNYDTLYFTEMKIR